MHMKMSSVFFDLVVSPLWLPPWSTCHNFGLGFATKARAWKVTDQEGSLGVTSHAPRNAKECEGMNPHIPK
jgi:hypothetical protein